MARTFTLADMAEIIGKLNKLAPASAEQKTLDRQVRNLKSKGLIAPIETRDGRGTSGFNTVALYRARFFTSLTEFGFDAQRFARLERTLADAAQSLSLSRYVAPSQKIEGGSISHGGLNDAIKGIGRGEVWELSIRKQAPYLPGVRSEIAEIYNLDDPDVGPSEIKLADILYSFTVPLNTLFKDLPDLSDDEA